MSWVKLDDQFFHNRKIRAVGPDGQLLFLASMCWCSIQLNDGIFPTSDLPAIAGLVGVSAAEPLLDGRLPGVSDRRNVTDRLIAEGLWHPANHDCAACCAVGQTSPVPPGHLAIHTYLELNRTRLQVVAAGDKARKAAYVKHAKRTASGSATSRATSNAESESESDGFSLSSSRGNSRDAVAASTDDDDLSTVPDETWTHYAELKLNRETGVKYPGPWKARTASNAKTELADQALRWWRERDVTPYRLAQALVAGQPPTANRRNSLRPPQENP